MARATHRDPHGQPLLGRLPSWSPPSWAFAADRDIGLTRSGDPRGRDLRGAAPIGPGPSGL